MELSEKTKKLLADWMDAKARLERASSEKISAQCALSNSTTALANWLRPKDAKSDEVFSIWIGERLLEIKPKQPGNDFVIEWRK